MLLVKFGDVGSFGYFSRLRLYDVLLNCAENGAETVQCESALSIVCNLMLAGVLNLYVDLALGSRYTDDE